MPMHNSYPALLLSLDSGLARALRRAPSAAALLVLGQALLALALGDDEGARLECAQVEGARVVVAVQVLAGKVLVSLA